MVRVRNLIYFEASVGGDGEARGVLVEGDRQDKLVLLRKPADLTWLLRHRASQVKGARR